MRPLHLYTPAAVLIIVAAACTTAATTETTPSPVAAPVSPSTPPSVSVLPAPPEVVEEVVDGRTVLLSNGLRARVLGLAAPGECWSAGALKFAKDTLAGQQVRYSRASESAITLRLLNSSDYASLAVSAGAMRAEKDDPVLAEPEKVAQKAGLGLWGSPCKGQDTTPAPAPPPPPPPAPAPAPTTTAPPAPRPDCSLTYRVAREWAGGFHTELIVRNNTDKPFAQWKLQWRFPSGQQIRETWGMTARQYGADVFAVSQDPNGSIGAGGQVSLRFNAVTTGPNVQPTAFTLSGMACSLG